MAISTARLIIREGSFSGANYPLLEQFTTLGRDAINDIVLNDPEISRSHARITLSEDLHLEDLHLLEDLDSTNGTFLNGSRIESPAPLRDGDKIGLGESITLIYDLGSEEGIEAQFDSEANSIDKPLLSGSAEEDETLVDLSQSEQHQTTSLERSEEESKTSQANTSPVINNHDSSKAKTNIFDRRLIVGCGCLLFLAVVTCATTIFLLDALAPEIIYCGPLESFFSFLGSTSACP